MPISFAWLRYILTPCRSTLPVRPAGVSAAVFFRFGLSRGGMRLFVETMFDLAQDFDLILRLGIEVARVIPLEMRLEFASCTPISIAEMVVDHGIGRFEVDRAFEFLHRLVVAAELVIRPAETIDDIPVVRALFDCPPQHIEGFLEVHALIDPAVAKIVQDQGMIGIKGERRQEVGLRLGPFLLALIGNPPEIIYWPIGFFGLARRGQGTRIGLYS